MEHRAAKVRLGLFAAFLAALFLTTTLSGSLPGTDDVRGWADGYGLAGPLIFIPLSALLSSVFVPGPVLAGAAGLLFGTALGTPIALASATLAATLQFLTGRYLAGPSAQELLPRRVRRFDEFVEHHGFLAVLYIRLTPGIPYTLANYSFGLSSLKLRALVLGTAVGAVPRTFAYVALGGSLDDLGSPEAIVAIVLLVVMAVGALVLGRRRLISERSA